VGTLLSRSLPLDIGTHTKVVEPLLARDLDAGDSEGSVGSFFSFSLPGIGKIKREHGWPGQAWMMDQAGFFLRLCIRTKESNLWMTGSKFMDDGSDPFLHP